MEKPIKASDYSTIAVNLVVSDAKATPVMIANENPQWGSSIAAEK